LLIVFYRGTIFYGKMGKTKAGYSNTFSQPSTPEGLFMQNHLLVYQADTNGKTGWIYLHKNRTNGKLYIGQTRKANPNQRWKEGDGYKTQRLFGNALKHYGWNGFSHEAFKCPVSKLDEAEQFFIKRFRSYDTSFGYNLTEGGGGHILSDLIVVSVDQYDWNAKFINNWRTISEAAESVGVDNSQLSAAVASSLHQAKGFLWVAKGAPAPEPYDPQIVSVSAYDFSGKKIGTWKSLSDASKKLGISIQNIHNSCAGLRKSAKGLMFRFEGEEPPDPYINDVKKPISQYSLSGDFIKEWPTISAAAKAMGVHSVPLSNVCKGAKKTCAGYQWRFSGDPKPGPVDLHRKRTKKMKGPIYQFDKKGQLINTWSTAKKASDATGVSRLSISCCLHEKQKSAGGFLWSNSMTSKSYSKSAHLRSVTQYTLDGKKIQTFPSIAEASRKTGVEIMSISDCCRGIHKRSNSFLWRYSKDPAPKPLLIKKSREVFQYSKNGAFINSFPSISAAGKLSGLDEHNIRAACTGKTKTCGGFIWSFDRNTDK